MKRKQSFQYIINFCAALFFFLSVPDGAHAGQSRHQTDPYSTHQPVLYEIAKKTSGPIIEFGCGYGSTDLLHEICKKEGRLLISIDDDREWLEKFSKKYKGDGYDDDNSGWHQFYFVPGKNMQDLGSPEHWIKFLDEFEPLQTVFFDLCFVDQSPWLGRWETLKRVKDIALYVIVHDCDYFPMHGIFGTTIKPTKLKCHKPGVFDFSDVFENFRVYYPLPPWPGLAGPPTLLGSNFETDLPDVDYSKKF